MINQNTDFWETCWEQNRVEEIAPLLSKYYQQTDPAIDYLKAHGVRSVCDAACGYGAYSLMLLSNGFQVEGFDIAPRSVEITKTLLKSYGFSALDYKAADLLTVQYPKVFDAVAAISVLEHMCVKDAKQGISALLGLIPVGGYLILSFDCFDESDKQLPHQTLMDGSFLYTTGKRSGMILHDYSDQELENLLSEYTVVLSYTIDDGRFYVIQK